MAQVPAARNTLRILALLSRIDVPVSAARIRAELHLPRSSTYHPVSYTHLTLPTICSV